jgi:uncharacterized protein YggE
MIDKKSILYLFTLSIITILKPINAQTNIQIPDRIKEITIVGEARAYLSNDSATIKIKIESSGANAVSAEKAFALQLDSILKIKDIVVHVQEKEFLSSTSNPKEIVKGSPLKVNATALLLIKNPNITPTVIDQILSISGTKITSVNYFSSGQNDSLKSAYAQAVENARLKAETLTKANGLSLGEIIEISANEELPPSSIRDQLDNNIGDINSGPFEYRILTTVKFILK